MTGQLLATLIAMFLVLAVAVGLSVYVIRRYVLGQRNWQVTEGRITHVGMDSISHRRSGAKLYGARVNYEYHVGGKTYHGSHIRPDYIYTAKEAFHREILKRYHEGKRVKVRYNARNPTEAFLEIGLPRILLVLFGLAILFLLAVFEVLAEVVTGLELL